MSEPAKGPGIAAHFAALVPWVAYTAATVITDRWVDFRSVSLVGVARAIPFTLVVVALPSLGAIAAARPAVVRRAVTAFMAVVSAGAGSPWSPPTTPRPGLPFFGCRSWPCHCSDLAHRRSAGGLATCPEGGRLSTRNSPPPRPTEPHRDAPLPVDLPERLWRFNLALSRPPTRRTYVPVAGLVPAASTRPPFDRHPLRLSTRERCRIGRAGIIRGCARPGTDIAWPHQVRHCRAVETLVPRLEEALTAADKDQSNKRKPYF